MGGREADFYLLGDYSERTASKMFPVPFTADLGLPWLRDVVGHAKREVPVVLDGNELHGDIGTADPNLQEATPPSILAVNREAARIFQALDEALRGVWRRPEALDFEWAVRDVLVGKFEVHCIHSRLWGCVLDLITIIETLISLRIIYN